ncbi:uncharacterized protein LOC121503361 isoform X2 [Cheilinus undulatus]|uniref:uncharacterized protein LOC121503361 isoform X2 n=1 Tax=Cheilinus undulatus TaxID=241271 RepID=UPI001BD2DD07|nr:uncharacterized protein LOC121503361 isoform X2 [Cheilinus undulatus]XP_041633649.1 uncharacterized protein LOC121503361 isoform X2 [Cheilinus undulatus]XP_041633651.1 uncharacterized protein LOC121503361 isoform X2 [Cheilinus undulatus]
MGNSESSTTQSSDGFKEGPDLKVNKNIVMFSSLTSTDSLKQHYEKRRMEAGDCAAGWIKSLAEKVGAFSSAPELAGLGALAVAVLIDILSSNPNSIKDVLQSVFAEEKASKVWDLIDEFLKRYRMYINDRETLKKEIKRIEEQLSKALTRLKNSMVRGGHVTNQDVKIWVNGAAFHIQMLIHLERLGGTQNYDPIKSLIKEYKEDLDTVFEKHEEMIKGKCHFVSYADTNGASISYDVCLVTEDSKSYWVGDRGSEEDLEDYYNKRFGKQKCEIEKHFSEVEKNVPELIRQRGSLEVRR